jgi:hypothetical protein
MGGYACSRSAVQLRHMEGRGGACDVVCLRGENILSERYLLLKYNKVTRMDRL